MKHDYGNRNNRNLKLMVVMARAIGTLDRTFNPDFKEAGLTQPQFGVLEALYHIGPMTVNEVIAKTLSSSGNMGVVIENLIKAGLAEKHTDPDDRRVRRVSLTPTGTRLIQKLFPIHMSSLEKAVNILSDRELDDLTNLMKKLGKGREGD
jgi:MarR family 2-MHQ and catechol resistance regulon transcriptional repressor